jgi:ABC-2 type transport system permease protein
MRQRGVRQGLSRLRLYFRVWKVLAQASLTVQMSTRLASLGYLVGKLVRFGFFLVFLVAIFGHVREVAGYSLPEVVLFFMTFNLVDIGAQFLFRGIYGMKSLIRNGNFDHYLCKPISPLFRVSFHNTDFLDLVTLIPVISVTAWVLDKLPGPLRLGQILIYLFLVGCGILVAYGIHVIVAAIAIATQELDNTIWVYRDFMTLGRFPVDVYTKPVRFVLVYIVPIAVMTSFPAKGALGLLSPAGVFYSMAAACILGIASFLAWRYSLRRFTSVSG